MAPRTTYANLGDGLQNLSLFDQSLADMGNLGIIPCTAVGTNTIVLTPIAAAFSPVVAVPPQQLQAFSFVAAATSTGPVTVNGSKLYKEDGVTQATTGDTVLGVLYGIFYNSALNGAAGGYQIAFPVTSIVNPVITGATISGSTITTSTYNGNTWTAGTGILTIAALKTLTVSNTLTFTGTDGNSFAFPSGSDTVVTLGATQALTSKTLTSPAINGATILTSTYNKVTITTPATSAVLTLIDGTTLTGPAASGTVMTLGNNETVTGVKTFGASGNVGKLVVAGTTSGSTVLNATAVASGTLSLPAATDTLTGKATTDILTNKTIDTAGTGNHIQISGVDITRGQILGESSTGSATAGNIGEYVETVVVTGSAVGIVTATGKTIATLAIPSGGDWDVDCVAVHNFNTTTNFTQLITSLSLVTNTVDSTPGRFQQDVRPANVPGLTSISQCIPPYRFSVSGATSVFLVAQDTFTVSTMAVYGLIRARRVR